MKWVKPTTTNLIHETLNQSRNGLPTEGGGPSQLNYHPTDPSRRCHLTLTTMRRVRYE